MKFKKEKFELTEYNEENQDNIPAKYNSTFSFKITIIAIVVMSIIILSILFVPQIIKSKKEADIRAQIENTDISDDELGEISEDDTESADIIAMGESIGNTSLNLQQKYSDTENTLYGLVASDENYIYLSDIKNTTLHIIDAKTYKEIASTKLCVSELNVLNNELYASFLGGNSALKMTYLCKVTNTGGYTLYENTAAGMLSAQYSSLFTDGNKFYLSTFQDSTLISMGKKGENISKYADTSASFSSYPLITDIQDGMLYYVDDTGYYCIDEEGNTLTLSNYITNACSCIYLHNDRYFYIYDNTLYIDDSAINLDGYVRTINIANDTLYIGVDKTLYSISLDEDNLSDDSTIKVNTVDKYDFYLTEIYNVNDDILLKNNSDYVIIDTANK